MPIERLFIATVAGGEQRAVASFELIAGQGIVGDRNFGLSKWPGQNITFIEREQIEAYNLAFAQHLQLSDTRRSVITSGLRLNDLVGQQFTIGAVTFFGVELCEPCSDLGERLQNSRISKNDVVKAFTHKGGLRADIISSGNISLGMNILLASNHSESHL